MGASDYLTVSGPQGASYAAPLVGFQLGQQLSNLPKDYFEGTQRARTLELQKPILDPNTGQPTTDIRTILSEMNRRGGGEFVGSLLPFLQKQAVLDQGDTRHAGIVRRLCPCWPFQILLTCNVAVQGRGCHVGLEASHSRRVFLEKFSATNIALGGIEPLAPQLPLNL